MNATTTNPALVLFLVDGSHSTGATWTMDEMSGDQSSICHTIQEEVNRALHDLIINVCYSEGELRERINLGVYIAQGEEVRWGMDCEPPSDGWLGVSEWANLAPQPDEDGLIPTWVEFQASGKTPLLDGWRRCFDIISSYVHRFPSCSVLLITLTDGLFSELGLEQTVQEATLNHQRSSVGGADFLHFIGHISPDGKEGLAFPSAPPEGEFETFLFNLSTNLPPHLFENGNAVVNGVQVEKDVKAYIHNADQGLLSELIQLGSRVVAANSVSLRISQMEEE